MKAALLLIDFQRDYLVAPGMEPGAGCLVERAHTLLREARERSCPVFHIWTTGVTREDDRRWPHGPKTGRWSCESAPPGHAPPPLLAPAPGETVIHQTSFSAFSTPELESALRREEVQTLILAGVQLHAGVRQTALDADACGFETWIAEDAVGSDDPVHAAITRRYLEARTVRLAKSATLFAELSGRGQASPTAGAGVTAAVRRASSGWKRTPPPAIPALLERVAGQLEAETPDLARQMAQELGKPIHYGQVEAWRTAQMLRHAIRRCSVPQDEVIAPEILCRQRPHGVVALITPWNNPIYIALGKIAPALLCGNTVIWKPSPYAEVLSRRLRAMFLAAGCPPEALSLLSGGRAEAELLMSDPAVAAVSLTGSSAAGFSAQEICARRRIPLQAELGGNNAAIVWDGDLQDAATQLAEGAFGMAGQRCTANRRIIVREELYKDFISLLEAAAAALPAGDPLSPETRIGPLVNAAQAARVAALVDRCVEGGLRVIAIEQNRFVAPPAVQAPAYRSPVLVCAEDPNSEAVQEETFGPVLVVQKARSWEQAMDLLNGVRQGLAAALFARSPAIQKRFLEEARAGILKLNQATADAAVDAPFGGWKESGLGPPEHGRFDLDFYLRAQTCYGKQPA